MWRIIPFLALGILFVSPTLVRADDFASLQQQILLLIQQVTKLQSDLNNLQKISNLPCYTIPRNLGFGDSGDDVEFLQQSLEKEGFRISGVERNTRKYDELTASAVTGFQEKYKSEILYPSGLQYGTGYFGRAARAKLNSIYGCGAKAPDLSGQRPLVRSPKHITLLSPNGGQILTSPINISGYINSDGWVTGSNPGTVALVDVLGRQLGQVTLSAKSDLKKMPIAFEGKLSFSTGQIEGGVLILKSQSTSTFLSQSEKEFRFPVRLASKGRGFIYVSFPQLNSQLIAGTSYNTQWQTPSGVSSVSIYLVDTNLENSGLPGAVKWKAENIKNTGSYTLSLPPNITGTHRVHILSSNYFGTSKDFFIYNRSQLINNPPVIDNVEGPTSLKVGRSGVWKIYASDEPERNLSFSVAWGDGSGGLVSVASQDGKGKWTAEFQSHSYGLKYNYPIVFSVTNDRGLVMQKTVYVNVID